MRDHPIAPVTEPMQYRAIGLVRGVYRPEDPQQFTRGILVDDKGFEIESVVLGRVLTLMRRHISLADPHLWVVYPRCRNAKKLHLQIAGIWEPSTLDIGETEVKDNGNNDNLLKDQLNEGDDYFSIRGELIFTKPETKELIIKIRQKPRKSSKRPLPFKIRINGNLSLDNLHKFISCDVRRIGQELTLENHCLVGSMPSKPFKKGSKGQQLNDAYNADKNV